MIDSAAGDTIARPEPLDSAAAISQSRIGEATAQRGQREDHEAEQNIRDSQQVAIRPPTEEAPSQRVGIHHPGEVVPGEVQVSADRTGGATFDDRCGRSRSRTGSSRASTREVFARGVERGGVMVGLSDDMEADLRSFASATI